MFVIANAGRSYCVMMRFDMRMSVDVGNGPPNLHARVEQFLCAVMVKGIVIACCGHTRAVPASSRATLQI